MQQKGHAFLAGVSLAPEDNIRKTKTNSRLADYILLSSKIRVAAFMSAAFLFVFLGLFVFPMASSIDGTQATSEPGEPEITISTSNLSLEFQVEAVNGSFSEDSTDVSVSTTSKAGYTLSIETGNDGDNASKLVGENKSFNSLSSAVSEADFSAADATELNGLWGFKPSKIDGENNTDYLPVPVETTTIEQTDAANVEANEYEIGLGARADFTYEAGVYTNTFVITSVVNPVGYTITYNKNTNDTVTNMPANQSGTTMEQTVTLASESPVRDGYEFRGWCDGTVSGHTCEGTVYQPSGSYSLEQATSVTLVAIWREETVCNPSAQSIDTAVCMQDMNSDVIETMVTEHQYQLTDSRDGKDYWIAKLADGNVWMTQNLDLDLDSNEPLSSENTDLNVTNEYKNSYSVENNIIYWTPDKSTTDISNGVIPDDGQSSIARSSDVGDWYFTGSTLTSEQHNYLSGNAGNYFSTTPTLTNGTHGHVGNYYNWAAATADNVSDPEITNTSMNSICPAGWRLPFVNRSREMSEELEYNCNNYSKDVEECLENNDFYGMIYHYNDGGFFGGLGFESSPAFLVRGGTVSGTALKNAGYDGYYWSSQALDSSSYVFEMMYRSTASDGYDWYNPARQRSVRCVARDSEPSTENNEYSLIYFDGNGADDFEDDHYGTHKEYVADQLMKRGGTVKLRPNKYTRTDYDYGEDISFLGWNTDRNGNGTFYADRADFTTNASEVTLYAQWDTDEFVVIYDSGLGDERTDKTYCLEDEGECYMYITTYNIFTRDGYVIESWNTEPDGSGTTYEAGYKYTVTAQDAGKVMMLYAQWTQPVVTFDGNGADNGSMQPQSIAYMSNARLNENQFTRTGYVFKGWNTRSDGTGTTYEDMAAYNGLSITLFAQWSQIQNVTVNYIYGGSTNAVTYGCYSSSGYSPRYSHSANVDDSGTKIGSYPDNLDTVDVITIPGATSLHVSLKYGTESITYDWVSMWVGKHPDYSATSNYGTGLRFGGNTTGKYAGSSVTTVEGDVAGDSITIGFRTDGAGNNYFGYYAVITAELPSALCMDQPVSGSYAIPTPPQGKLFAGWDTSSSATTVVYVDEAAVKASFDLNTSTVNLYAVYVDPVALLDDGYTVNNKLKNIEYNNDSIHAIKMADALPNGFVPTEDNTISDPDHSTANIYAWYETVEEVGTLYVYSENGSVKLNSDSAHLFNDLSGLCDIDGVADWDASLVTSLEYAFAEDSNLANVDALEDWDVSNLTNMHAMFDGAISLSDFSGMTKWNTSSVINMSNVFQDTAIVDTNAFIPTVRDGYTSWDTSSVETIEYLFAETTQLVDIFGIANWDMSSVENMGGVFYESLALTDVDDLAGWNVSNVTNMGAMFWKTDNLEDISGLANWNISNVTDMEAMFANYSTTSKIDDLQVLNTWSVASGANTDNIFYGIPCAVARPTWYTDEDYCIVTVEYNANGGTGSMDNQVITKGDSITLSQNSFTRSGYLFNGWNVDQDGKGHGYGDGDLYQSSTYPDGPITVTMYAQWLADSGSGGSGGVTAGITLQHAFEIAYVNTPGAFDMGNGQTKHGLYYPVGDGTYREATTEADYQRPANELRFAIQDIGLIIDDNGVNKNVCEYTTVIGSDAYVLDLRDYTSYYIAKLADGRCWMQDNLVLDPTQSSVRANLTPANTNATQAAITNYLNGGNPDNNAGWAATAVSYETSFSSYTHPFIKVTSKDKTRLAVPNSADPIVDANDWKYGVYYNYCAVSIGTYCYASGGGQDMDPISAIDVKNDICPAGWRMPTGGAISSTGTTAGGGEYQALSDAYPTLNGGDSQYIRLRKALRLPLSGFNYLGSVSQDQTGKLWSSTYYDDNLDNMYSFSVSNLVTYIYPQIEPQNATGRDRGDTVRCIAK